MKILIIIVVSVIVACREDPARGRRRMSMEAQRRAIKKYDKENTVFVGLKLNLRTDADIIAQLDDQENKQGYIKQLIRDDMKT